MRGWPPAWRSCRLWRRTPPPHRFPRPCAPMPATVQGRRICLHCRLSRRAPRWRAAMRSSRRRRGPTSPTPARARSINPAVAERLDGDAGLGRHDAKAGDRDHERHRPDDRAADRLAFQGNGPHPIDRRRRLAAACDLRRIAGEPLVGALLGGVPFRFRRGRHGPARACPGSSPDLRPSAPARWSGT